MNSRTKREHIDLNIRTTVWYDYFITGNQYLAIAINLKDPKDAHYFDIDPEVNNDAFVRACGWAYPGCDYTEEEPSNAKRDDKDLCHAYPYPHYQVGHPTEELIQKVEICGGLASNYQIADEEDAAREFLNRKD